MYKIKCTLSMYKRIHYLTKSCLSLSRECGNELLNCKLTIGQGFEPNIIRG